MFTQDITKDYGAEFDNCINGPSVVNEKHIAVTINPYDYYNNGFSEEENGQHSENQTKDPLKQWPQKTNFTYLNTDEFKNSLQVGLFQSNLAENNYAGKSIQNVHTPICAPLKVDGSMSFGPSVDDGVNRGYTECHDDIFKSALTREGPLEKNAQNDIPDYSSKHKIDGEAIVDLAANKHNRWNRIIHDYLWCPFVLLFVFFCCVPAILLMHKSDIKFQKGRDPEARRWAICSSLCYGIGLVLTLVFYAMIFALVFVYTK